MDYKKVYEDKYHHTYKKLDEYIVRQFKEGYHEGQNFSDLYNYVAKALQIIVADLSQEPLIENNQALIDKFRNDGIVWGVGRGSSCASYVLFLLFVNDVDPVRFGINFSEMSKEVSND